MTEVASELTLIEQQAYKLAEAAMLLDRSRATKDGGAAVMAALDNNLEVWAAFTTVASMPDSPLAANVRDNLVRLRAFVAQHIAGSGEHIQDSTLDTLININLQISEGLLEGQKRAGA